MTLRRDVDKYQEYERWKKEMQKAQLPEEEYQTIMRIVARLLKI